IPVLAFRLTEAEIFAIDPGALAREGLHPGPWLRELKGRWKRGTLGAQPLEVMIAAEEVTQATTITDDAALYRRLRADRPAASIGYTTDVGFTASNRHRLHELLMGVSLLCCECTFLAADQAKARASHHLCSSDVNRLAAELRPKALLPMHLSKAYINRPFDLYDELSPPEGTRLLRLPDYVTPRPLLLTEFPQPNTF
ncbi:MAG: MBL fold metallo-hydrolase, partial [Desulfuromonadales bacterium]